jgi:hypothetical protein
VLSSPIIDLAIGLTFVFGVTAAFASLLTELIARLIGLRGAYLLSGLRELVDGGGSSTNLVNISADYTAVRELIQASSKPAVQPAPAQPSSAESSSPPSAESPPPEPSSSDLLSATGALLGGPILSNQGIAGQFSSRKLTLGPTSGTGRLPKMTADREAGRLWSQLRSLPSYISAKSFADAVIDLLIPDSAGQTTMTTIQDGIDALPAEMPLKPSLDALVKNAGNDISRFRTSVEQWYDDHMDRVSGWYKRHVAIITLVVGAILVVLLNLNVLTIGRTLYTENAVSTAVSTVAAKATSCSGENQQECLANLEGQLSAAAAAGLPIGWGTVRDCTEPNAQCNWLDQRGIFSRHGNSGWQLVLALIGFLIMIMSLVPGAQFWFGLLTKLSALRETGPKPTTAASNSVNFTIVSPLSASTQAAEVGATTSSALLLEPKPPPEPKPPD